MISHISVTPGICTPDGKYVKCMHGTQANGAAHDRAYQAKSSNQVNPSRLGSLKVASSHHQHNDCHPHVFSLVPIMHSFSSTLDRSLGSVPKPILKLACSHDLSPSHHAPNCTSCESPNSPPEDLHMIRATVGEAIRHFAARYSFACLPDHVHPYLLVWFSGLFYCCLPAGVPFCHASARHR